VAGTLNTIPIDAAGHRASLDLDTGVNTYCRTMDGLTIDGVAMRIGELAERTGVSRRSLRYYEQRGLLQANRNHIGWREYDHTAVARVVNVRDLLAVGLTVEDIHRISPVCLQQDLDQAPACDEAIEMYAKRLAEVDARITTLQRHRVALAARLGGLLERRHDEPAAHACRHDAEAV
jgi:DNA-binding transcriptional MerR regulator